MWKHYSGVFIHSLSILLSSAGTVFVIWWFLANGTCSPQLCARLPTTARLPFEGGVKPGITIAGAIAGIASAVYTVFALFGLFRLVRAHFVALHILYRRHGLT
jgi:hypothetical protein